MSSIHSSTQNSLPLYTPQNSFEETGSRSHLKAAVIGNDAVMTLDHVRPLHTRSIEQANSPFKTGLKAAILGTIALVGTAGAYCVRRYFVGSDPDNDSAMSKVAQTGFDISHNHGMVSERSMPTALPLGNQVALTGSLFQISRQFFTEAGGGFIQQIMTQGPSWLTCQLNPIVSNYASLGDPLDLQVIGNTAYVAGSSGLQIIDISMPNNPTLIGTYLSPDAWEVQVIGTIAYLAGGNSGLRIINISTPSSPTLIGMYKTPGRAYGVQVVGKIVYVADDSSGLQIINIATPSSPTLIGTYSNPGAYGVQVVGNTAYMTYSSSGLTIINIANPSSPTLIGTYNNDGWKVQVVGTTVYAAGEISGFQIINIATPSRPTLIGSYNPPGRVFGVHVVGTIAYVVLMYSGLQIIDIANPSSPTLIWSYNILGNVYGVQVVGTTAYIVDRTGGLQILSGLNQLTLSGTPSAFDQGNYIVTLVGITTAGTASTSFNLNVVVLLAPVYQSPISTLQATVGQSFNYIMPNNIFVDPNGDAMTYTVRDLPRWLHFDGGSRTFSGKPTPGDTGSYADKSTVVTVIANNGKLETAGQFTVTVSGDSYLSMALKVVGPTLTALGMLYSGYKNRALLLDRIAKRKWKNNQMSAKLGENFLYKLKTNVKDVRKVQAYVRNEGGLGKISERILCGKQHHIALASGLPMWMRYSTEVNALHSMRPLEAIDFMGYRNMQIRVLGSGSVIQELLKLELVSDVPTVDDRFDTSTSQEQVGLLLFPPAAANFIEMDATDYSRMSVQQAQV